MVGMEQINSLTMTNTKDTPIEVRLNHHKYVVPPHQTIVVDLPPTMEIVAPFNLSTHDVKLD
jgi:hypothetical protein